MSEVELREPSSNPSSERDGTAGVSVSLPTFEGPLDLLLHLCQKHELNILDIPIGFITEKYLEYLAVMQLLNLDLASEYLVMAATLAHIKSKMLLPAPPPGQEDDATAEDEEDPRESLIRRLLEYQKYKQAGADLAGRGVVGRDVFFRGMPVEAAVQTGLPPLAQVPLFNLVEAFQAVLAKSKIKLSHDIVHERMTLTDRINELVDVLRVRRRLAFEELFTDLASRFDLVITFLALLEMTRLRMTRLFQADGTSPIYIEFTAGVGGEAGSDSAEEPPPGERPEDATAQPGSTDPGVEASPETAALDAETAETATQPAADPPETALEAPAEEPPTDDTLAASEAAAEPTVDGGEHDDPVDASPAQPSDPNVSELGVAQAAPSEPAVAHVAPPSEPAVAAAPPSEPAVAAAPPSEPAVAHAAPPSEPAVAHAAPPSEPAIAHAAPPSEPAIAHAAAPPSEPEVAHAAPPSEPTPCSEPGVADAAPAEPHAALVEPELDALAEPDPRETKEPS